MVKKSVYDLAMNNKQIASQILVPLIEFEFGFLGDDSPALIQSPNNKDQLIAIFNICKKHNWLRSDSYKRRGPNLFFRISRKGFIEIYSNAGPFCNKKKREWADLLVERFGKIGGYKVNKTNTEDRVMKMLKEADDWVTLQEICLKLRVLPGTVRMGIKQLKDKGFIERKRESKAAQWRIKRSFPQPH
jgi:hypothetical protein